MSIHNNIYIYTTVFFYFAPCLDVHRYSREHLLSLRYLKECLEIPEGLFFPGAIELVRKRADTTDGIGRHW